MGRHGTIAGRKEAQDRKRAASFTKIVRLITVAARGGENPEFNVALKHAIVKAKAINMPNDNIDRAIKKGAGELEGAIYEEITYEGYGPGGAAVIVQTLTDNKNRTAADVRHAFDKNGGNLGTNGCVSFLFNRQGKIYIGAEGLDEDEVMMTALDAGAEDFEASEDGFEITTTPEDFGAVLDAVNAAGITPESAEVAMVPSTETKLSEEDTAKMEKMLDMFDDNDDIQEVYHNWEQA